MSMTTVRHFDIIKAALPDGYVAVRAAAMGRTSCVRYEIFNGPAFYDNWTGDVVYWIPENSWDAQPSNGPVSSHKYAIDAVRKLIEGNRNAN